MKQSLNTWETRFSSPSYWVSVWFGSGLLRPAPGTWGSLVSVSMAYAAYSAGLPLTWALVAIVFVTLVGVFAINRVQAASKVHDAPEIVVDEVAGQWIAILPLFYTSLTTSEGVLIVSLAFIFFRIFDIWKPWPIGWVDKKLDGGLGVMLDDLIAGIIALIGIEIFLILLQ